MWQQSILEQRDLSSTAVAVTIVAQGDRAVLTGHTLTATLQGTATNVLWSSATGTFNNATSLTPTYTPTTIGHQEVLCTPSRVGATGVPAGEGWDVTRSLPVAANATASTVVAALALQTEALSDSGGADGVTWSTVVQRYTTGGTLQGTETVGGTSTAPTWTPSALDRVYRVTSTATDTYGRTSAVVRAVAANETTSQTSATITSGAPAQQSSISGVSLALTLVGAASSYAWGARLTSAGTGGAWATTGFSSSTSATPTYTRPTDDDYEIRCVVTMSDGSTPEARSTVTSINAKPGGAGVWTTTKEWDFTTDVTDATFAASGSDQSLFAADGTTVKATIRVNTRTGSPTATTSVATGVGLSQTQTVASAVRYCSIKCTAADTGITFSTPGTVAIDMLLSSVLQAAATEKATVGIGNAVSFSTGNHFALRILRNAGPSHAQYGARTDANVFDYDVAQNAEATQPTDFAVRFIIQGGSTGNVYWSEGSSAYLEGIPTPSGSVFTAVLGAVASAVGAALPLADPFYLTVIDLFTAGASSNTINVKKVRIQRFT